MSNKNKEMEAELRAAFEAGEAYANECTCGKCDYCLDIKYSPAPDCETWLSLQKTFPTAAYTPIPLNEGSESVEALAALFVNQLGEFNRLNSELCYLAGYTASQQATMNKVVAEIERLLDPDMAIETLHILTDLLTKFKTINI